MWLYIIGTHAVFIERIKRLDTAMFIDIHKRLAPIDFMHAERMLMYEISAGDEFNNRVICTVGGTEVRGNSLRTFRPAEQLNLEIVNVIVQLFNARDSRIKESSDDVNSDKRGYRPYRTSVYCEPQIFHNLMTDPFQSALPSDLTEVFHVYFIIQTVVGTRSSWALIVLDTVRKAFYYFNPTVDHSGNFDPLSVPSRDADLMSMTYSAAEIADALNRYLDRALGADRGDPWRCRPAWTMVRFELNEDDFSEGLYIITIVYYLSYGLPMVFKRSDLQSLRHSWVHWVLMGALPA